jgi:hypothetical protein
LKQGNVGKYKLGSIFQAEDLRARSPGAKSAATPPWEINPISKSSLKGWEQA